MIKCTELFVAACKVQSNLNAWVDCRHQYCREKNSCTGGPRGTCAKTDGWPLCTQEGMARLKIAKSRKYWPGEQAPENETPSECRMRRLMQDFEDTRLKMRIAGYLNR